MKLTNTQIYNYATSMMEEFGKEGSLKLPVKINFYLQKNLQTLISLGQEIEEARMKIVNEYGRPAEESGAFFIPEENIEAAQKELSDLFALEQDVQIYTVKIDAFDDSLTLTMSQMEALMFMIE
jgi:hypothetical protein